MIKLITNIYVYISAAILYLSMLAICKTLRIEIRGREEYDTLKKAGKNVIFAVWHQATFVMFYLYRGLGAYIFVTSEVRGQILGKCAEWMGFRALPIFLEKTITQARSTARVLDHLRKGSDVVLAVDGPTGPLYDVKPGAFFLSEKTGVPIVPAGVKAPHKFTLSWRWDRYFIPVPFSKVTLTLGKALIPQSKGLNDLKKELQLLS